MKIKEWPTLNVFYGVICFLKHDCSVPVPIIFRLMTNAVAPAPVWGHLFRQWKHFLFCKWCLRRLLENIFKNLLVHNFLYKNRQKKVSQNIFFSNYSSTKYKNSKQLFFEKFYPKLTFSTLSLTLKVSIFETSSLNVSPNGTQVSAYFIIDLPL